MKMKTIQDALSFDSTNCNRYSSLPPSGQSNHKQISNYKILFSLAKNMKLCSKHGHQNNATNYDFSEI